jgi:hypothetical protein
MGGTFIHADHFTGMLDLQACAIDTRMTSDQFFEDGGLADKDQV